MWTAGFKQTEEDGDGSIRQSRMETSGCISRRYFFSFSTVYYFYVILLHFNFDSLVLPIGVIKID